MFCFQCFIIRIAIITNYCPLSITIKHLSLYMYVMMVVMVTKKHYINATMICCLISVFDPHVNDVWSLNLVYPPTTSFACGSLQTKCLFFNIKSKCRTFSQFLDSFSTLGSKSVKLVFIISSCNNCSIYSVSMSCHAL